MSADQSNVQVRFCPAGRPTIDVWRTFSRLPQRGETIEYVGHAYVVVEVWWGEDGDDGQEPMIIAHAIERPRAQEALRS